MELSILILTLAVAIHGVQGGAMVSGSVFCDQCKDGQVSLFDYPLSGMKVTLVCSGQATTVGEKLTDMLGNYVMTFDGTPDLSSCYTQISGNSSNQDGCRAASGPPKSVRLMFTMFDMSTYSVDPLISQPANPMSFCPNTTSSPPPSPPSIDPSPAAPVTPVNPPTAPKSSPTPTIALPPMPHLPLLPFTQPSACPYQYWTMKEYKCYWRAVNPEMKVALVFGPLAAEKYGTDMTLRTGLQGKGDPYRTLLRETITSLLNSYNSFQFSYSSLEVLLHFNTALTTASNRSVLLTALRFKRANSGHAHLPCDFTPCN